MGVGGVGGGGGISKKRANQRLALNLVAAVSSMALAFRMEDAEVAGSMIFGDGGGLTEKGAECTKT